MANFSGGYILTQKGEALQAKVEAGKMLLTLTRIKVGNGIVGKIQDYYTRGALVNPINDINVESTKAITIGDENACLVKGSLTNNAVESGYLASEMGLYAYDVDGSEILFAVSYDDKPTYIAGKNDGTEITMNFEFYLVISAETEVIIKQPLPDVIKEALDKVTKESEAAVAASEKAQDALERIKILTSDDVRGILVECGFTKGA